MELTIKMLESLECQIEACLYKTTEYIYETIVVKNVVENRVELIVYAITKSGYKKYVEAYTLLENESSTSFTGYIQQATNLEWEYIEDRDCWYIKSGYVVFQEAFDDHYLEQFNEIEGIEFHSPVVCKNGEVDKSHVNMDSNCQCPSCTWEPDLDNFDFAREMPGEEE